MPLFSGTTDTDETETAETEETSTESTSSETTETETNLPEIELVIEDGTGVSNANSYCDLDYAMEYCTMKGYTDWQSLSEDMQKIYIIRGTEFVNNYYTWKGVRKYRNQACAFPRLNVYDLDHYEVEGIPEVLKKACLEAAWLNASSGSDTLFTTSDANGKVKRQKVDSLEVEYFSASESTVSTSSSSVDYTSIYDILNKLLKGLYKTSSSVSRVCSRTRIVEG